jgi:2-haloacid dehalogenase
MPPSSSLDFSRVTHLSFDCYGTLIDWEKGILRALASILRRHGLSDRPASLLRAYARHEARLERGPYHAYRKILRHTEAALIAELQQRMDPSVGHPDDDACSMAPRGVLARSLPHWQPFADTIPALMALSRRFRLVILSNVDDDLLATTVRRLGVPFQATITAAQVHAYKPAAAHFETASRRLGLARERWVHVAQSVYHDHVTAKQFGLATVWVRRRSHVPGHGVALPASAQPELVVPDLKTLATLALA